MSPTAVPPTPGLQPPPTPGLEAPPTPRLLSGMARIQGDELPTFAPPELEGSMDVCAIVDSHVRHSPEQPFVVWSGADGRDCVLKGKEWFPAIFYAARVIGREFGVDLDAGERFPLHERPIIAMLTSAEHQRYYTMAMGIIRAGAVVFPIANGNSAPAIASLLRARKVAALIVDPDGQAPELAATLERALAEVKADDPQHEIKRIVMPPWDDMFSPKHLDAPFLPPMPVLPMDALILTLHSSGTTAFPKPVDLSLHSWLCASRARNWLSMPFGGRRTFLGAMPPYHALGVLLSQSVTMTAGSTVALSPPSQAWPPSPVTTLKTMAQLRSDVTVVAPIFLQLWAQDDRAIEVLKRMDSVGYGGGPLSEAAGNKLAERGVRLANIYGSTEAMVFTILEPLEGGKMWAWSKRAPAADVIYRPTGVEGEYEIVLAGNENYRPSMFNDTYMGKKVWAMGDIVVLHPKDENYFKIIGRMDDQIMLSSGEKINPAPLLTMIQAHPSISGAVFFGRGRPFAGVIVEPAGGKTIDPEDDAAIAAFRREIWPVIERVNAYAPAHAHIWREMIVVASPSKAFTRTGKGSLRNGAISKEYVPEIERAYERFEEASVAGAVSVPAYWDETSAYTYMQQVVAGALERDVSSLSDEADIFQVLGADSLRATVIRNTVHSALSSNTATKGLRVPANFVYDHPNIRSMAAALLSIVKGDDDGKDAVQRKLTAMTELIGKYTAAWPKHVGTKPTPQRETLLVTGTTGGVGAHILEQALKSESIEKVFAVNRPSQAQSIKARHQATFTDRGLDVALLDSPKLSLLEARLEDGQTFGLRDDVYAALRDETTCIYHVAWRLDFNLSLSSFEGSIAATRSLIDLSLASPLARPPPLIFTSSIGTLAGWKDPAIAVPEEPLNDLSISLGAGYGESKAVTERILLAAAEQTPIDTLSVRLGQMSGSTTSGCWAVTDWLPLIVKTGSVPEVACLPEASDSIAWLPSDVAATALLDFRSSIGSERVLNLVHPRPVPWTAVMSPIAEALKVPLVPFAEWLARLNRSPETPEAMERNPALKLRGFFAGSHAKAQRTAALLKSAGSTAQPEAFTGVTLSTTKAQQQSSVLRQAPQLGPKAALAWLHFWRRKQFVL